MSAVWNTRLRVYVQNIKLKCPEDDLRLLISSNAEGVMWKQHLFFLWRSLQLHAFFFMSHVCAVHYQHLLSRELITIKNKISLWSPVIHPPACITQNGIHTHVRRIFCAVTPADKRLWTKPFSCCFTASLMISAPVMLWKESFYFMSFRSVSAWPRGRPVMPLQRFCALGKKRNLWVCCDHVGLPWWMRPRAHFELSVMQSGKTTNY